jgi:cytochrome c-type biogenesis protein CcmH
MSRLAHRRVGLARSLLLLALSTLALLAPAAATAAAVKPRTSLPVIEPQVMCVLCKIPLNVAQSAQANYERQFIQEQINKGDDEAQVKQALVAQYGPLVLGLPAAHGFDLTVYLVPLAVVLALIALLVTLVPSWRRHARAAAKRRVSEPRLSPADSARLDSDLARFD